MPDRNVIETWMAGVGSAFIWLWALWGLSWVFPVGIPSAPNECMNFDSSVVLILSWVALTAGSSLFWFNFFRNED